MAEQALEIEPGGTLGRLHSTAPHPVWMPSPTQTAPAFAVRLFVRSCSMSRLLPLTDCRGKAVAAVLFGHRDAGCRAVGLDPRQLQPCRRGAAAKRTLGQFF